MKKTALIAATMAALATPIAAQQNLKLGHYYSPDDFRAQTAQYFADRVMEKTDEVTIDIFPNESLVKGREALQGVSQGTVDIYPVFSGYISGQVPLVNVFSLPFPPESYDDEAMFELAQNPNTAKVLDETFEQYGIKYLGVVNSTGPAQMFLSDPVEGIADLKGKKIRGAGGLSDEALSQIGASVTMLSAAEQFLALQTGTVDGITTTWSSYVNYGLYDVAPTYLSVTVLRGPYLLMMNKAKYDGLSSETQNAIAEAVDETVDWSRENFAAGQEALRQEVISHAENVVEISDEDAQALRNQMQPIYDSYVERNGEAGAQLMELWQEIVAQK